MSTLLLHNHLLGHHHDRHPSTILLQELIIQSMDCEGSEKEDENIWKLFTFWCFFRNWKYLVLKKWISAVNTSINWAIANADTATLNGRWQISDRICKGKIGRQIWWRTSEMLKLTESDPQPVFHQSGKQEPSKHGRQGDQKCGKHDPLKLPICHTPNDPENHVNIGQCQETNLFCLFLKLTWWHIWASCFFHPVERGGVK